MTENKSNNGYTTGKIFERKTGTDGVNCYYKQGARTAGKMTGRPAVKAKRKRRIHMKVLGISFGRRNQRSDVMVKEALFAAKAAGADVEFINTVRMNIGHCRACDYCSRLREIGRAHV